MRTNTSIKNWKEHYSHFYHDDSLVKPIEQERNKGACKEREINELRAALEAANHRIEDLTTAANRCINDALGMTSTAQQGDGVIYETVSALTSPELHTTSAEASFAVLKQGDGELPPLPTPCNIVFYPNGTTYLTKKIAAKTPIFNAAQMSEYARSAIAQHAGSRDGLFDRKLGDLELRGYEVIGRILHKEGQYALFDSSCRWLSKEQYRRLMHEQDDSLFATGSQPDSERDAALREGMTILNDLVASIQKHGNYTEESTLSFLHQLMTCISSAQQGEKGG